MVGTEPLIITLIKKLFPKFKINNLEIIFQQYKNHEKY